MDQKKINNKNRSLYKRDICGQKFPKSQTVITKNKYKGTYMHTS